MSRLKRTWGRRHGILLLHLRTKQPHGNLPLRGIRFGGELVSIELDRIDMTLLAAASSRRPRRGGD